MKKEILLQFVAEFYKEKDLMHDLTHINRILKTAEKLMETVQEKIEIELIEYGAYFHGCINTSEYKIKEWLISQGIENGYINKIIEVSKSSLKENEPTSIEGKILHDAHMLEGGKYFLLMKSLITGSVRGQSLEESIKYFKENVLNYGQCFLPETRKILLEYREIAKNMISNLEENI